MTYGCPGVDSRGHGLTMSDIHAGGCCERWDAERAAEAEPEIWTEVTLDSPEVTIYDDELEL